MADAMVSQAMELEADLLNNFALALLKAPCFERNKALLHLGLGSRWSSLVIISRLATGL